MYTEVHVEMNINVNSWSRGVTRHELATACEGFKQFTFDKVRNNYLRNILNYLESESKQYIMWKISFELYPLTINTLHENYLH